MLYKYLDGRSAFWTAAVGVPNVILMLMNMVHEAEAVGYMLKTAQGGRMGGQQPGSQINKIGRFQ